MSTVEFQSMNNGQSDHNGENSDLKIGSWLILFAIGLVLYPAQTLFSLVTELIPAVFSENWAALRTPTNPGYHSLWAPLLVAELVGNSCFFVFSIFIVVFFFQRRRRVVKLIIIFLIANIVFVSADYVIINFFLIRTNTMNVNTTINFVRTVVAGAIWIPYFLFSRRVEKTFTR
jgi:hypothetical protein